MLAVVDGARQSRDLDSVYDCLRSRMTQNQRRPSLKWPEPTWLWQNMRWQSVYRPHMHTTRKGIN